MSDGSKAKRSSVRITGQSVALLDKALESANDKNFGSRITAGDVIALALSLVKERHIAELQNSSRTQEEKFSDLYAQYLEIEKVTKECFFDKLMSGEIPKSVLKSLQSDSAKTVASL